MLSSPDPDWESIKVWLEMEYGLMLVYYVGGSYYDMLVLLAGVDTPFKCDGDWRGEYW